MILKRGFLAHVIFFRFFGISSHVALKHLATKCMVFGQNCFNKTFKGVFGE